MARSKATKEYTFDELLVLCLKELAKQYHQQLKESKKEKSHSRKKTTHQKRCTNCTCRP